MFESSTELGCDRDHQRNKMVKVYNDLWATVLSVFLCSRLHFLPHCDSLPLPHPHLIIILTLFPHPSLTLWLSCLFMLCSSPFPSSRLPCRSSSHPSVPYHYYEPSGPDECSMYLSHERSRRGSHHRFITEKIVFANWARTLNIRFNQPDWKPAAVITSMNSSYTPVPAGSWDSLQRRSPDVQNMCVDSFKCADSLSGSYEWDSSRQNKLLLWLLAYCLSSLAEWDHCIIASQSLNNVLEV